MQDTLITIEGIDGVGKATQSDLLTRALRRVEIPNSGGRCYETSLWGYPQYDTTGFGKLLRRYLGGEFGGLDTVSPWISCGMFAGDRFEDHGKLLHELTVSDIVVCDRYVDSNIAHQVGRLRYCGEPLEARLALRRYINHLEYETYGAVVPSLTLLLQLPQAQAARSIATRRATVGESRDIHEDNGGYQLAVAAEFSEMAVREPARIKCVDCTDGKGNRLSAHDVHLRIMAHVMEYLLSSHPLP